MNINHKYPSAPSHAGPAQQVLLQQLSQQNQPQPASSFGIQDSGVPPELSSFFGRGAPGPGFFPPSSGFPPHGSQASQNSAQSQIQNQSQGQSMGQAQGQFQGQPAQSQFSQNQSQFSQGQSQYSQSQGQYSQNQGQYSQNQSQFSGSQNQNQFSASQNPSQGQSQGQSQTQSQGQPQNQYNVQGLSFNQQPKFMGNSFPPGQSQPPPFQPPAKVTAVNVDDPQSFFWQHQTSLCQLSRSEDLPHFYARQYAQNSRKSKNPYADIKNHVTLVDATKTIVTALEEQEKQQLAAHQSSTALMRNKKQDLEEDEEHRMIARTQGKQLWCHMDLSGQGLLTVSPKLFRYDFLESLYLNNNKLTAVPSIIKRLNGLRVLDLSQNRISEVPPELGLCYNLRYLYLFDNNIKTLPYEFRNLIELLFLGIEGNPIDLSIANLISERGTKALISYFRDMNPTPQQPKPRSWLLLEKDGDIIDPVQNPNAYTEDHLNKDGADSFTMMSYNTLCQHYATTKLYKYTPSWALEWNYRKEALKEEIVRYNTDVICLQEVETRTFHDFWMPIMTEIGYKGFFFSKTRSKTMSEQESKKVDGCATFYRTSKFQLIQKQHLEYNTVCMGSDKYKKTKDLFNRFMNKDHIALITYLQHLGTGEKIVIVNTHLHWDPAFNDVKALQVGILLEELQEIIKKFQGPHHEDAKNTSMVICGDFNSTKSSAVYQLISTGSVSKHEDMDGRDYGKFTDDGFHHSFKLKSAYDHIASDFPFSNFTPTFTNEIDYIWYSTNTLQVKGLLGKADEEYFSHQIGIPDAHFPSDHIPLVTKFEIKKKGTSMPKKPEFKPDFKSASSRKT